MKKLSIEEAEYISHALATELFATYDEPMPEFSTRYPGKLESCLEQPFQTFGGEELYGVKAEHKAAAMFYFVIKNHPFENGNKRMAVTLTLVFLYKNKLWLKADPEELYKVALKVAESKPKDKDIHLKALRTTFEKYVYKHKGPLWPIG